MNLATFERYPANILIVSNNLYIKVYIKEIKFFLNVYSFFYILQGI